MVCPICQKSLSKAIFYKVEVDYCPACLGIFFEEDELRQAKDEKDKNLRWLDIDLWQKEKEFQIAKAQKLCPKCEVPFYQVNYGNSKIKVDLCNLCSGIWLDRGEFKKIIDYLKEKADYEILNNYLRNFLSEAKEIFSGPETFKEEILDFLTILKLLNYKFW
jgi:Zn-finger nucleic acid-binding protein